MIPDPMNDGSYAEDEIFRILCDNIPGVVYLCANDERYSMTFLTEAVFDLVGYPAVDFLENRVSFVDLFHPDDSVRVPEEVDRCLEQQKGFHLVYRLRHAQGHWVWVEEWGQGVFSESGELRFLEGSIFSITDRKLAEEELRRSRDELEERVASRTSELAKANQQLLEDQNTLRELLDRYERQHRLLAYEIHDGMVQYATGALMQLETAKSHQKEMDPKAGEACEKAQRLLTNTIREGRQVISGLRPPILDELGIAAAIEYLIHEEPWDENVKIELDLPKETLEVRADLGTTIFRIAQEAINNVRQHSKTDRIAVSFSLNEETIRLEVRDWGVGYTPGEERRQSFGLRGIQERAKLFGGTCTLESAPGEGTRVLVELPLESRSWSI